MKIQKLAVIALGIICPCGLGYATERENDSTTSLAELISSIQVKSGGKVAVSVRHIETNQGGSWRHGFEEMPLYSVFKLPLAVVVLKDVEAGKLQLDQRVSVKESDVAPGIAANTDRWRNVPLEMTVRQLLELSLIESDNTSSDKLLQLTGGPGALTKRIESLGFDKIKINVSVKEMSQNKKHLNVATAESIVRLLSGLQQGSVLKDEQRTVLFELMGKSRTGLKRLRGLLPAGTAVLDKTGTGPDGSAINDVGIVTLPGSGGHLAVAVLISGSKLPVEEQEHMIAEIALASYKLFTPQP